MTGAGTSSELADELFEELVALEVAAQMRGCSALDAYEWSEADQGAESRLKQLEAEARATEFHAEGRRLQRLARETPYKLRLESYSFRVKPDRMGNRQPGGPDTEVDVENSDGYSVHVWVPSIARPGQTIEIDLVRALQTWEVREVSQTIDGAVWTGTRLCAAPSAQRTLELFLLPEPEPEPEPEPLSALDDGDTRSLAQEARRKRLLSEREVHSSARSRDRNPRSAAGSASHGPAASANHSLSVSPTSAHEDSFSATVNAEDGDGDELDDDDGPRVEIALAVFVKLDEDDSELLESEELDELIERGAVPDEPSALKSLRRHIEEKDGMVAEDFEEWWEENPEDAHALFGKLVAEIRQTRIGDDQAAADADDADDAAAIALVEEGAVLGIYLETGQKKHDRFFRCSRENGGTISWSKSKNAPGERMSPRLGSGPKTQLLIGVDGRPYTKSAREWFDHFDTDGTGALSSDRLAVLYRQALGKPLKSKQLASAMVRLDKNLSGSIGFEEFAPWWSNNGGDLEKVRDSALSVTCGDGTAANAVKLLLVAPSVATKKLWVAGLRAILRLHERTGPPQDDGARASQREASQNGQAKDAADHEKQSELTAPAPEPEPEPHAESEHAALPAVSSAAALSERGSSPLIQNLCSRADLNYPTPEEVQQALDQSIPKGNVRDATVRLRKSAAARAVSRMPLGDVPTRDAPEDTSEDDTAVAAAGTRDEQEETSLTDEVVDTQAQAYRAKVLRWVNGSLGGVLSRADYDRLGMLAFEDEPIDDEDWEELFDLLTPAESAQVDSGGPAGGLSAEQLVFGIDNDELTFPGDYDDIAAAIDAIEAADARG